MRFGHHATPAYIPSGSGLQHLRPIHSTSPTHFSVHFWFGSNPTKILVPALKCATPQAHGDLDTIGVQLSIDQSVAAPSRTCQLPIPSSHDDIPSNVTYVLIPFASRYTLSNYRRIIVIPLIVQLFSIHDICFIRLTLSRLPRLTLS